MNEKTSQDLTHDLFQIMKQFPRVRLRRASHGGIKGREYDLLALLALNLDADTQTLTVTDISNLLRITPAGATHLLNSLEDIGCIQRSRSPNDRRVVLIGLSDKGREIANAIIAEAHEKLIGLVEYLGEDDSATLVRLMSKMIEYFNARTDE